MGPAIFAGDTDLQAPFRNEFKNCSQIKERYGLFQAFSLWDGEYRRKKKKEKKQVGGLAPSPSLPLYFFPSFDFAPNSIREL